MKILNICIRDYAGIAARLSDAVNKFTEHNSRQLIMAEHKWGYPYDILTKDMCKIREWVDWADVVNCWGQTYPLRVTGKIPEKLIITHVGSYFRNNPKERHDEALKLGATELVCTPDLSIFEGLRWLPNVVPVDEWFKMKEKHNGKPIVCQSPSSLEMKRTPEILAQLHLKSNIELLIINKTKWRECMKLKSKADIYTGEFNLGYGMSELEAMAMKIPVITKLKPENEAAVKRAVGYLPHYDCRMEDLSDGIDALLSNRKLYEEYAELGFKYVKQFHDYPVVAKMFTSICEELTQVP